MYDTIATGTRYSWGVAVKTLVEYRIDSEGTETVVVEVDEPLDEAGEERAGFLSWKSPRPTSEDLEASFDRITPAANLLMSKLRSLADRPDEATIEFGVKLTAKAGAVLASAGVEANFNVTLTWKRHDTSSSTASGG
jgi:hypothetical protein